MSRYVAVALLEIDNEGSILTELSEGTKIDTQRDITKIEGKVPFVRFGIVDRGRRNKVVYSTYNFETLLETLNSFRGLGNESKDRAYVYRTRTFSSSPPFDFADLEPEFDGEEGEENDPEGEELEVTP